jgi:hypothetical protein
LSTDNTTKKKKKKKHKKITANPWTKQVSEEVNSLGKLPVRISIGSWGHKNPNLKHSLMRGKNGNKYTNHYITARQCMSIFSENFPTICSSNKQVCKNYILKILLFFLIIRVLTVAVLGF